MAQTHGPQNPNLFLLLIQTVAYSVILQSTTLLQLQTLQTCLFSSVQLDISESTFDRVATLPWPILRWGHGKNCMGRDVSDRDTIAFGLRALL